MPDLLQFSTDPGLQVGVDLLVRTTLVLAVAALLAVALRRASAAVRHFVWGAGLVAMLAVPVLSLTFTWEVPVLPAPAAAPVQTGAAVAREPAEPAAAAPVVNRPEPAVQGEAARSTPPATGEPVRAVTPLTMVLLVWGAGAVLVLGRLTLGAVIVRRMRRRARPLASSDWTRPLYEAADRLALGEVPDLLRSDETPMPFACGLFRPAIVLPREADAWTDRRRRAVLSHELAHLRRFDLPLNALGQITCALYWFHPLVWMAQRRLRLESERACDDLVLGIGTRPSEYADHLLQIVCRAARAETPAIALPMAQRKEFEGRMLAILEADAVRRVPTRRWAAGVSAAAVLVIVPLAGLEPTARLAPADDATGAETVVQLPAMTAALPEDPDAGTAAARPETESDVGAAETARDAAPTPRLTPATRQDTVPRVIAALIGALRDSVASVREDAAYALGQRRARAAVRPLAALLLEEPNADVREITAWSLAQLHDDLAATPLASVMLNDASSDVREMAAWALGQLRDSSTVNALGRALQDPDSEVREAAGWALGQLHPRPAPAALLAALRDDDSEVREVVAWALGQIRDGATINPLLAALRSEADGEAREAMMWAIGRMDSEVAQDVLVDMLRDDNPNIRAAAARALAGGRSNPWPWPWPRPQIR